MLSCPTTGQGFDAGIDADEVTFKGLPDTISMARCPHCGQKHSLRTSYARRSDALNDSKPHRGLPRALTFSCRYWSPSWRASGARRGPAAATTFPPGVGCNGAARWGRGGSVGK
jgi:hypothetical protein